MRIKHKSIKNICVIQLQPFGDVFLTTSYFKALKEFYPGARLTYLMKEPYQKIVLDHPYIDQIISIKKAKGVHYLLERLKTFRRLRNEKFDLVIDQQNMPSSQVLAFMSGAPYRLGYKSDRKNLDFLYNIQAEFGPTRYSALQKYDILKPLGINEKPCSMFIPISDKEDKSMALWMNEQQLIPEKTIVISPGTPYLWKKWPAAAYAHVADKMRESYGFKTVILWGPGEEKDAENVKSLMKGTGIIAPPTTFQMAGAIMKRSAILLCNDNGISHSSVAFGIKTITVFCLTNPLCWSPASVYKTHRHLHNQAADKNDPCFGISPDMVFDEIKDFLCLP